MSGLTLHAAVRVDARDRKRLEQLWRGGTTPLVMGPLEFMKRLAALVPRPRLHRIRFHGVLAPNAKLRPLVVPEGSAAPYGGRGIVIEALESPSDRAGPRVRLRRGRIRLLGPGQDS